MNMAKLSEKHDVKLLTRGTLRTMASSLSKGKWHHIDKIRSATNIPNEENYRRYYATMTCRGSWLLSQELLRAVRAIADNIALAASDLRPPDWRVLGGHCGRAHASLRAS
ncbi:hypothetical protein BO86DRAFT_379244 [Aspergillus japonicus CBS 114.51]|uniref:Uncharacterized protein n=1 Tax=Aspergillus japonicus CBS 114.51 TaxID=1448312 RepID=A0A8T8X1N3_ASPJA|nr:hypothetical protein BO86DRAFT_379244 [Aspergillus japonicus CBS 114.51]RAH82003.1 hypothetical protein BO86DRAFT_379244 [Aspergillus japonicus CBS 114.51]